MVSKALTRRQGYLLACWKDVCLMWKALLTIRRSVWVLVAKKNYFEALKYDEGTNWYLELKVSRGYQFYFIQFTFTVAIYCESSILLQQWEDSIVNIFSQIFSKITHLFFIWILWLISTNIGKMRKANIPVQLTVFLFRSIKVTK